MNKEELQQFQDQFRHAVRLQHQGELEAAVAAYEGVLRLSPRHRSTLLNLGVLHYSMSQFEKASEAFGKILEDSEGDLDALYNLGRTCLKQEEWAKASECFKKLLEIEPADRAALLSLGFADAGAQEHKKALDSLNLYLSEDPTHRDARLTQAHCLIRLNKAQEASGILKKLVEEDSGLKEAWSMLSDAHEQLGQDEKAISALKRLVLLEGESSPLFRRLGLLHGRHNQFSEARKAFSRAMELEREETQDREEKSLRTISDLQDCSTEQALQERAFQIGSRAQEDRDFKTALQDLAALARRFPDTLVLLQELGYLYQILGEHKRASVYYSRILEKEPRHLEARLQLIRISMTLKDVGQRHLVEETLGLYGDTLEVRELVAAWFLVMEDYPESIRLFQECLDSRHHGHGVYEGLGEALLGMERAVEAERVLNEGSNRYPDSLELVVLLADAQLQQKRTRKANATLRRARGTFHRSPRLLSLSATAACQSEKPERARGFFRRLAELPNSYEAGFEAMAKSLIAVRDVDRVQKLFRDWSRFRMKSFSWLYIEGLTVLLKRNSTRMHLVWQELWHAHHEKMKDKGTELRALLEKSDLQYLMARQAEINPFFARRHEVRDAIVELFEELEGALKISRASGDSISTVHQIQDAKA